MCRCDQRSGVIGGLGHMCVFSSVLACVQVLFVHSIWVVCIAFGRLHLLVVGGVQEVWHLTTELCSLTTLLRSILQASLE